MSKSSRSSRAQKTHRKVQSSSAHNRKTVSRPNYKKTTKVAAKKSAEKVMSQPKQVVPKAMLKTGAARATKKTKNSTQIKVNTVSSTKVEQKQEQTQKQPQIQTLKQAPMPKIEKRPLDNNQPVVDIVQSDKIQHFVQLSDAAMLAEMDQAAKTSSETMALEQALDGFDMGRVNERMNERKKMDIEQPRKVTSAQEIKDNAIKKAMQSVSRQEAEFEKKQHRERRRMNFGIKRIVLSLACATAAMMAIVYFVNLNAPDVSIKVAAMQSGIDAKYPSYVPRDFAISDISSENGRIVLNFKNSDSGSAFSLVEESSSWDSTALLNNYVKSYYDDDFTVVKEQGLTLYMTNTAACWVNGGVVYKLNVVSGSLTKKQIKTIATSL